MLPMTNPSYHSDGPKDLGLDPEKKSVMSVDIARTTNHTGEQIHIAVPLYSDDDRAAVARRLGFAFSVIQDRMEAENLAVQFANEKNEIVRRGALAIEANNKKFQTELEGLNKSLRKKAIDEEAFKSQRDKRLADLHMTNGKISADIKHAEAEIKAGHELPRSEDGEVIAN